MIISTNLDKNLPIADTAVALGFFDGIHRGHKKVIELAVSQRSNGLIPCVFTFSMDNTGNKPKNSLIQTEELKEHLLEEMGVEYMLCPNFEEFRGLEAAQFVEEVLVKRYRAKFVCCGENFRFGKGAHAGVAELLALCSDAGIELVSLPLELEDGEPISSSRIRAELAEGNITKANLMLGHPYTIIADVCHGAKLGRTINFPTANQEFPKGQMLPKNGVYASVAHLDGIAYAGATNVGTKPTVGGDHVIAETFMIGYEGDAYGKTLRVRFYEFLRGEEKFASIDELKAAIEKSITQATEICGRYLQ